MTIIRISTSEDTMAAVDRETLVTQLTKSFARIELGCDNEALLQAFCVVFDRIKGDDYWIGVCPARSSGSSRHPILVQAFVMAGPWSDSMKRDVYAATARILNSTVVVTEPDYKIDLWMTIVEIPDGGWSFRGETVSIMDFSPFFSEDRQRRIDEYLSNKAV